MQNVIKNGLEYTRKERPGLPEKTPPCVYVKFRASQPFQKDMERIGLALAQMILSRENAVIQAQTAKEGGGQFRIRFYKTMV